jgi:hypothetical protein
MFRDAASRNATIGVLGIFLTGIFLTWFPIQVLRAPLPRHPVDRALATGLWQTLFVIVMPYVWSAFRLRRGPQSLGLTVRSLPKSTLLGCALYSITFTAFLLAANSPLLQSHPVRHLPLPRTLELGFAMCMIAAGTDVATRGFILLSLVERTNVAFAVLMQNVFWLLGHTHEIKVLTSVFGTAGAVGLFVLIGVLGDSIVLKTRNVVGLAIGHILLNVAMITYLRNFA